MAFGKIDNAFLFGLPGNPVAVMVTFYQFVRDALLHLSGAAGFELPMSRSDGLRKNRQCVPLRLARKSGRRDGHLLPVRPRRAPASFRRRGLRAADVPI